MTICEIAAPSWDIAVLVVLVVGAAAGGLTEILSRWYKSRAAQRAAAAGALRGAGGHFARATLVPHTYAHHAVVLQALAVVLGGLGGVVFHASADVDVGWGLGLGLAGGAVATSAVEAFKRLVSSVGGKP